MRERFRQFGEPVAGVDHRLDPGPIDGADKIFQRPAMGDTDALDDRRF